MAGSELRVFTLVLTARPDEHGRDPVHALRALLKVALRRYGLRCTSARELPPEGAQVEVRILDTPTSGVH